ncbi:hypothetical protein C8Q77DRAFT_1124226 [Trametes polyzona]|nr:hypothetical protein C8Q77DRAFT_1124226 [Trametes polyzona]
MRTWRLSGTPRTSDVRCSNGRAVAGLGRNSGRALGCGRRLNARSLTKDDGCRTIKDHALRYRCGGGLNVRS